MTNLIFTLVNKNGGFAVVSKAQYKAWVNDPSQACQQMPELVELLHKQTLGRGFSYADFRAVKKLYK